MAQNNQPQNQPKPSQPELKPEAPRADGRRLALYEEVPTSVEGMIYTSKDNEYKHVPAGSDCSDMRDDDLKAAMDAKHVVMKPIKVDQ